jgi:hypothetical protein
MNRLAHVSRLAVLLAAASGALAACQALAGIEDRKYDPAGSGEAGAAGATGTGPSAECEQYCSLAKQVCQGKNTLYPIEADDATCLATCALLDPGILVEPKMANTVACRVNQLLLAQQPETEPSTIPDFCASAGPGGNGTCGSSCESYCQLFAAACTADFPQAIQAQYDQKQCVAKCAGLADNGRFDAQANYTGDTLQCRLVHISAALGTGVDGRLMHCPHAQLQAQTHADPAMPCIDDPTSPITDCDAFCQLELAECSGEFAVYESRSQCVDVCHALPPGTVGDTSENTVGCRKYHSYNAMDKPEIHCPHTGPGGDGHCGSGDDPSARTTTGNCESYCLLLQAACNVATPGLDSANSFRGNFATQRACSQACGDLPGAGPNQGYSVAPEPTGNSVQCRLLHASRALSKPLEECPAALGGAPCQ